MLLVLAAFEGAPGPGVSGVPLCGRTWVIWTQSPSVGRVGSCGTVYVQRGLVWSPTKPLGGHGVAIAGSDVACNRFETARSAFLGSSVTSGAHFRRFGDVSAIFSNTVQVVLHEANDLKTP